MMETLWQDIRYGWRRLARSPAFAVVVISILAIGIGATTAVFSVVHAVVLRPLPYADSDRIVTIREQTPRGERWPLAENVLSWKDENRVFESVAFYGLAQYYVASIDRPREVMATAVSANLFPLLGVRPLLGRGFLPEEQRPGNNRVMILSHALWQESFGADPNIAGKTVCLVTTTMDRTSKNTKHEQTYTIVGVMPAGFSFPFSGPSPFWTPWIQESGRMLTLARLKKGVTLEQARAAMAVTAVHLRQKDPKANADLGIHVYRLLDRIVEGHRTLLLLMLGAAGLVLLIACTNVANLFLVRATLQQGEAAVRVALGASRWRIARQMLFEGLVLSMAGGLLGLTLAFCMVKGLVGLCPADVPRLKDTGVDPSVLAFALAVSILTGLLFCMVPAWRASEVHVGQALKETGRSWTGWGWRRVQAGLVVCQIGLSLVLLMGAGLVIRSLIALQGIDLGFQPRGLVTMQIALPTAVYPNSQQCKPFFDALLQQIRGLPHVRSAGIMTGDLDISVGPLDMDVTVPGQASAASQEPYSARWAWVTPGFFEALGVRILRGRSFTEQDDLHKVVIDQALAVKCFGDTDPVGRTIQGEEMQQTVIGVVATTREFETPEVEGSVYSNYGGRHQGMAIVVRTEGDPKALMGALRTEVAGLTKDQVITRIETLEAKLGQMLAPRRFSMVLLGLFAGIALILAAVGVYGLLQYSTAQQTREIGIRMALGARGVDVLRTVLGRGLRLTLLGVAVGVGGAWTLTRLLSSLLYEVRPMDGLTLAYVSIVLTAVALLASYLPARRAARIDPMVALRYE
jgi:putative ABC transport system permease protein